MGHRFHLSTITVQIAIAIALAGTVYGQASPEPPSKQSFEVGVKAYQDGKFAEAAAAFEASYASDPQPDTLFAWAQAARKAGDCTTAIKLFDDLLAGGVAAENKDAVVASRQVCVDAIGNVDTTDTTTTGTATGTATGTTANTHGTDASATTSTDTSTTADTTVLEPSPPVQETDGPTPWYKDPVGASLLAGGTASLAIGVTFFVLASSADSAKDDATDHADFVDNRDKAESRAKIATLTTGLGVALIGGGVAWYLLRPKSDDSPTMSAWMGSSAGGVVVSGRF
jgi:hypothetical protein